MNQGHWFSRLQARWKLKSAYQVVAVLVVFACTGFSVLLLKRPLLEALAGEGGKSGLATTLYYIFILPLYNVLLLFFGAIFGQFPFFWEFEKKFLKRLKFWGKGKR